jgi:hypothetical protein
LNDGVISGPRMFWIPAFAGMTWMITIHCSVC